MSSEGDIQAHIALAIGARPGVRVFRNHVGFGWSGKLVRREGNRVLLADARPATFGLAPGSADLIGWRSLVIGPEMVGLRIAQFASLEVKTPRGSTREAQLKWHAATTEAGALAGFVRSISDAVELIEGGL